MKKINLVLVIIISVFILFIGYWALMPNTAPEWTGFGAYNESLQGPRAKVLWDWLDLLVVPLFLAMGAYLLSSVQKESEKNIELDRQRQNTLDSFVNKTSTLLLEKKLRKSKDGSEVRSVARTYTRAALRNLDGVRKAEALQFLSESGLIASQPIISLLGADLTSSDFTNAALVGVEIKGAQCTNSNFQEANLSRSSFCGCDFSGSKFDGAILDGTDLSYAILKGARLRNLDLTNTNLEWANLEGADLTNTTITRTQLKNLESTHRAKLPKSIKTE